MLTKESEIIDWIGAGMRLRYRFDQALGGPREGEHAQLIEGFPERGRSPLEVHPNAARRLIERYPSILRKLSKCGDESRGGWQNFADDADYDYYALIR